MKLNKQTVTEFVIALVLVWAGVFALSGCVVSQAKAYQIIQGVK